MRYEPLPSSFFAGNREELASRLPAGSMLILHANDVFPTNADGTFALHQNANLFYLTGVDQEETVLVMTIREDGWDEILLLRETNEQIAIWEGARLSQEQARELSGIQDVPHGSFPGQSRPWCRPHPWSLWKPTSIRDAHARWKRAMPA